MKLKKRRRERGNRKAAGKAAKTTVIARIDRPARSATHPKVFDYSELTHSVQRNLRKTSTAIRELLVSTANNIVQIGLRLNYVHGILERDSFQGWLREEFQWSQSVASNYMRAAAAFEKVDCIDRFQPGALYALARHRASNEARTEAVERAKAGEFISAPVAETIIRQYGGAIRTRPLQPEKQITSALKKMENDFKSLSAESFEDLLDMLESLVNRLRELRKTHKPSHD